MDDKIAGVTTCLDVDEPEVGRMEVWMVVRTGD
jgi:hypothetical protein